MIFESLQSWCKGIFHFWCIFWSDQIEWKFGQFSVDFYDTRTALVKGLSAFLYLFQSVYIKLYSKAFPKIRWSIIIEIMLFPWFTKNKINFDSKPLGKIFVLFELNIWLKSSCFVFQFCIITSFVVPSILQWCFPSF